MGARDPDPADVASAVTVAAGPRAARGEPTLAIPGYRVLGVIGEGGMGTVYEAEQHDPQRRVAIKVLFTRSPNALVRFKAEAQIMARLDHPGIARVLEAGEADGKPFLVMEHVDGETLDIHVKAVARAQRIELFAAICDAVHHAHLNGVIHRDLKPANVMVRADRRVVILDFGVARLAADDGSTPGDTRAGELVGTPLYMSPEQARLRADEVDARSDVYTLGVILYELACNELPYDIRGAPLPAVTLVISEDPPIPLGKRDAALRGDLEAITGKALAKEPRDRYQSVAALADDVRRFLDGRPVSVRTPSALERTRRFVQRRPLAAATIAGGLVATAAFAGVVTVLWLDARAAREVAEAAGAAAEARSNQLVLGTAREALGRDPTDAVAWLATLTTRGVDPGTAWSILDEATARGVAHDVLRAHTDEVHWIEPLGDGFVTGGYDGRAIVWPAPAFAPRVVLTAQHGRVHAVRPSPDGSRLAIGCDLGEAHVTTVEGRELATLSGHAGDVQHLAWSPDGAWLATADDHGNTWVWPHGLAPGRRLTEGKAAIGGVAFSDDSRALIAGDHDGHVWMWSVGTWTARTAETGADLVTAWSDGAHVAVADSEGTLHRWHADGDALVLDAEVATKLRAKRAVFVKGGAWVVFGGVGGAVTRVEGDTIETLAATHHSQVRSLAVSDDGRWIADGGDDGTLLLRDRRSGRELALRGHTGRIRHVELAGGTLLSSDSEGVVRRWELPVRPALFQTGAAVVSLASNGTQVAAVDEAGDVWQWTLAEGRRRRVGHQEGRVTALALAGGTVVTGTAEGAVTWWLAEPVRQSIKGNITAIATSQDRVAVASAAGPIALYSTTGAPLGTLAGNSGGTETIAFDPGGVLLASGGQDRSLRLWRRDGDTFVAAAALDGLLADLHFVRFTPTGELLVAAGNDGVVRAWAVSGTGVERSVVVARHTGAITALAIDPTGRWIASAGRDNLVIRTAVNHRTLGASITTAVASAAIALAVTADGELHVISRAGAVERVEATRSVVEIDHGVRTGVQLSGDRWLIAHDDGAIVLAPLTAPGLESLPAAVEKASRHRY